MPQFDILFFSILNFFLFILFFYFTLILFANIFFYMFKIRCFPKNYDYQVSWVLLLRERARIREEARISMIKIKIVEFYDR